MVSKQELWKERDVKAQNKLLTLVLKCSNFEFNGKHVLQIQGTAMGTQKTPVYANIFMGRLEKQCWLLRLFDHFHG